MQELERGMSRRRRVVLNSRRPLERGVSMCLVTTQAYLIGLVRSGTLGLILIRSLSILRVSTIDEQQMATHVGRWTATSIALCREFVVSVSLAFSDSGRESGLVML